ncbi:aminopeptidase [Enterobacillus tribolii]|uniref:IAP aminopeptidase n=1 Tax=Enterobacillus tribolii TaxID=1487935 RepID=A0A370QPT8_9GAMM|nr:aminopeptidase [Enterobacillus tribolii]MBW7981430.1 aminopeptidase [Enterobacillus tribolii]RDK90806.1 IAP aminopeptidase [Enterobacillus tribolii]
MFFRHLLKLSCAIAGLGLLTSAYATSSSQTHRPIGFIAEQELRHISTYYPGRMAGSPAELMTADYINQRFKQMGYQSDLRDFKTRYLYTTDDGKKNWHNVTGTSVIAVKPGNTHQQILITAHLDTYTPMSDSDVNENLGGLTLQGSDDNASGVGVLLELAERLRNVKTNATLRFLVLSGEEIGNKGAADYISRMSSEEKRNTQLVINIDAVITGDRLYFHSGKKTTHEVAGKTRDRAIALAKRFGIPASVNEGHNTTYPKGTGCCSDQVPFDNADIPVLSVEASNWNTGRGDGYQQTSDTGKFPGGSSWHKPQYDNLKYLDEHLPGRIKARTRDTVKILLPLVEELAGK